MPGAFFSSLKQSENAKIEESVKLLKRLHLVKTTNWQRWFLNFSSLAPMGLHTSEFIKSTPQIFFSVSNRAFRLDFSNLAKNDKIWPYFGVNKWFKIVNFFGPGQELEVKKKMNWRPWPNGPIAQNELQGPILDFFFYFIVSNEITLFRKHKMSVWAI